MAQTKANTSQKTLFTIQVVAAVALVGFLIFIAVGWLDIDFFNTGPDGEKKPGVSVALDPSEMKEDVKESVDKAKTSKEVAQTAAKTDTDRGTIQEIDNDKFTLLNADGETLVIHFSELSEVQKDNETVGREILSAGDPVSITFQKKADKLFATQVDLRDEPVTPDDGDEDPTEDE